MDLDAYVFEDGAAREGQKVDISRYWKALKKRWWVVVITAVVVTVPWVLYVKQEKPVYEATAAIRFTSYVGNDGSLMAARYQKISSRSFSERVVSELGLVLSIAQQEDQENQIFRKQIFAQFTSSGNPVPGRYILRFSGKGDFVLSRFVEESGAEVKLRRGEVSDAASDTVTINGFSFQLASRTSSFPPEVVFNISGFRAAVKSLQNRIRVEMPDPTMMQVTLRDSDPYVVTQTVNSLASVVVQESQSTSEGNKAEQRKILEAQMDRAKADLEASNEKLKYALQHSTSGSDIAFQDKVSRRNVVDRELTDLKNYRETLKDLLGQLGTLSSSPAAPEDRQALETRWLIFKTIANHKVFENNAIMALNRTRLEGLEKEWNEIVTRVSASAVRARELQSEIDKLHSRIEDLARTRLTTLERDITQKGAELNQIRASFEQLTGEKIELADLQRENQQKADIHAQALSAYQKARLEQASKIETIDILDPAIEPELPINSNKRTKAAGGGAFGFILGIFIVIVWELLDRTIKTVNDIKNHLKLDVLGAIPQVGFDNVFDFQDQEKVKMIDQQLVTHDFSPTPISEAYRSLRTSIIYNKKVGRVQTVVLTSTAPGDGKSFTAANFSITLAQQKTSTLLVDTDLRRGVQHNTFGVPKEPGFSNFLCGQALGSDIINETHIPNLWMISCGSLVPNPSELLGSLQMRRFLDEMRRKFDIIIFDTPPLNAATDAVVLGTQVDGVAIVVRAGKTNREVARQKLELFQNLETKIIGVILNGTTVDLAHEGYSYYHY